MNQTRRMWFAVGPADAHQFRCASCRQEFDFSVPHLDHHPRACPACGVECAFLDWKGHTVQVVMRDAPAPLRELLRFAQKHLDELEFVEMVCALEEVSEAIPAQSSARV